MPSIIEKNTEIVRVLSKQNDRSIDACLWFAILVRALELHQQKLARNLCLVIVICFFFKKESKCCFLFVFDVHL